MRINETELTFTRPYQLKSEYDRGVSGKKTNAKATNALPPTCPCKENLDELLDEGVDHSRVDF